MSLQNRIWKTFWKDTNGSIGIESIWAGVVITFFFAPTAYLYRYSEVHLDASWAQRSAAMNETINGNCNGLLFIPIPLGISSNVHSKTSIDCTKVDGEKDVPSNDKFWKKMDKVTNDAKFNNFTRDMKNKGSFKASQGRSFILHEKDLQLGNNSSGGTGLVASVFKSFKSGKSKLLAPSADYYIFDKPHWKNGHDKRVWEEFSSNAKKMFPNVYPARNK
jgi:hypothetical protein